MSTGPSQNPYQSNLMFSVTCNSVPFRIRKVINYSLRIQTEKEVRFSYHTNTAEGNMMVTGHSISWKINPSANFHVAFCASKSFALPFSTWIEVRQIKPYYRKSTQLFLSTPARNHRTPRLQEISGTIRRQTSNETYGSFQGITNTLSHCPHLGLVGSRYRGSGYSTT